MHAPSVVSVLAESCAEQVPDAAGEGEAERSADDHPQDGAADVPPAQVGAEAPVRARGSRTAARFTRDP